MSRWHSDYVGHATLHTAITRTLEFLIFFDLLNIEGIIILVLADLTLPRFPCSYESHSELLKLFLGHVIFVVAEVEFSMMPRAPPKFILNC